MGNPGILTTRVPESPTWIHPSTKICPYIETGKQGTPIEVVQANFLAHLENHPSEHIFTDGSRSNQHVGYAAVLPNTAASGRLPAEASIFTAELYAIKVAVEEVLSKTFDKNVFIVFSTLGVH